MFNHDDVIKWKHFPRYWPFVRFPAQRQVTRSFDVPLICVGLKGWINNREAGDSRRYRVHYDVTVMPCKCWSRIHIWDQNQVINVSSDALVHVGGSPSEGSTMFFTVWHMFLWKFGRFRITLFEREREREEREREREREMNEWERDKEIIKYIITRVCYMCSCM